MFQQLYVTPTTQKRQKIIDPGLIRIAYDARVPRPWTRGKDAKFASSRLCFHCHREAPPGKPHSAIFSGGPLTKVFCYMCKARFKGSKPTSFAMTKQHFTSAKATKSAASRRLVRTGPPKIALTALEAMICLFENSDRRELVGWTYPDQSSITTSRDRILCGTLMLAMPLRCYFKDGFETKRSSKNTPFPTMAAIFRHCPDKATALCRLERKTEIFWASQQWDKVQSDGRAFVTGGVMVPRMKGDSMFHKVTEKRQSEDSELLLWVDTDSHTMPHPLMITITAAAVLHMIFVQKRVALELVLDSEFHAETPPGTQIGALDLSLQAGMAENVVFLTAGELLTLDLLYWVLDRPAILGKMDVLTVKISGNYSAAVRNTEVPLYGFKLGRAFVELVDAAVAGLFPDVLSVSLHNTYSPARELGIAERCAEIEREAFLQATTPGNNEYEHPPWPPALPFERRVPNLPFTDLVHIICTNADACEGYSVCEVNRA